MKIFGKCSLTLVTALIFASSAFALARPVGSARAETMVSEATIYDPSVRSVFDSLSSGGVDDLSVNDYYEGVYFSNLKENFGNNRYGSCSYVAMGMLLSFYDSYWSDSFVPEAYDVTTTSAFTTYSSADFAFPSFYAESPGVAFEPDAEVGPLSLSDYLSYAAVNADNYFQCKLISLSQSYLGSEKFESSQSPFGMTFSEIVGFLEYYLYDYRGFTASQVAISSCNDAASVRSYAISKIRSGVPVILRATSRTLGGPCLHSL